MRPCNELNIGVIMETAPEGDFAIRALKSAYERSEPSTDSRLRFPGYEEAYDRGEPFALNDAEAQTVAASLRSEAEEYAGLNVPLSCVIASPYQISAVTVTTEAHITVPGIRRHRLLKAAKQIERCLAQSNDMISAQIKSAGV